MRRIASLVLTALLISTATGCSNRNTAMRNQGTTTNQGTTQGTRTGYTTGVTQVSYHDGVYSGLGDTSTYGTQTASVAVKGGRITTINLGTFDNRGNRMIPPTMGAITGITNGGTGNSSSSGMSYGTGNASGPGMNYRTGSSLNYGVGGGSLGSGNTGTTTGGANSTTSTSVPDYQTVRSQLITAMLNAQSYNVSINQPNTVVTQNWKLAVRRALDKARY